MIKIEIPVTELNKAIMKVAPAVNEKSELLTYKITRLEFYDNTLKISSYGDEIFIVTFLQIARQTRKTDVYVMSKALIEIISSFSEGMYSLVIDTKSLKLSNGKTKFNLKVIEGKEFVEPSVFLIDKSSFALVKSLPMFIQKMKRLSFFAEQNKALNYTSFVHLSTESFIVTNSFILAIADNNELNISDEINLMDKTVDKLLKIIHPAEHDLYYLNTETHLAFWYGETFISVLKAKSGFPNYQMVTKKTYDISFSLPLVELKKTLARMLTLEDGKRSPLNIQLSPGIAYFSRHGENGDAEDIINDETINLTQTLLFNVSTLLEGCSSFTGKKIGVKIIPDENSPVLFYDEGCKVYVCRVKF